MLGVRILLCALAASVIHLSVGVPLFWAAMNLPGDTLSLVCVLALMAVHGWAWFALYNWLEFVTSGRRY